MSDSSDIRGMGHRVFLDETDDQVPVRVIRNPRSTVSSAKSARGGRWFPGSGRRAPHLKPERLVSHDGRRGWRVRLPGNRPLATPATGHGRLFTGGGFGSHEFYSFDAATGRPLWTIKTRDDGPTAATFAGGYVAFNTESCTVYVVVAATGRIVWEKWLGDPLMAQTTIVNEHLFVVYPDEERRHQLAAFDLVGGKMRWRTELVADMISAPVAAGDSVYGASIDGTVYRIHRESGRLEWSAAHSATSAPWVHRGKIYLSLREEEEDYRGQRFSAEGLDTLTGAGVRRSAKASSRRVADYLQFDTEQQRAYASLDAGVGFAAAPSSAKLHMASKQLGVGHVSSLWAYEGSRPEVFEDGIFNVLDDVAQRLDVGTKKPLWRVRLEKGDSNVAPRCLSSPAVTEDRLYFTSALGDLLVLDRKTGEDLWSLNVGSPIPCQPTVAEGKVFLGTTDGCLYAFDAHETDGTGWSMWGGGPGHNGPSQGA